MPRPKARPSVTEAAAKTEPLHVKYRPTGFPDVKGQDDAVRSIKATLSDKSQPHAYLFTGPTGTGKTTLARIVAGALKCSVTEVDAASNSGIDEMRAITEGLRYNGFGDVPNKAIILNECQGLSKQAWDSLLTTVEEPPPHVFFFFTSTHPAKIPAAMVTRCQAYHLKPVRRDDLMDLLEEVRDLEDMDVGDDVIKAVAAACDGSPRQALTMLAKVAGARDMDEVHSLLEAPGENAEIIELCRLLMDDGLTWTKLCATIKSMEGASAESVRIVVTSYFAKVALGAKDKAAPRYLDVLEAFAKPCNPTDGLAPVLIAFGRLIYP